MENRSNRMFDNMMQAARANLQGMCPEEIARKTNAVFDTEMQVFRMNTLGTALEISYPDYVIQPELSGWHQLLVLHYLYQAEGMPLIGQQLPLSRLRDGMIRGGGFDLRFEQEIAALMQEIHEEEFICRCQRMGGKLIEGNADIEILFSFFPNYPVYIKIWLADEEFPASGRMLLDASADHYLSIEDAVTVGEVLLEKIKNYGSV